MKLQELLMDRSRPQLTLRGTATVNGPVTADRAVTISSEDAVVSFSGREATLRLLGHGPFVFRGLTFRHTGERASHLIIVDDAQVVFEDCRFEGVHAGGADPLAPAIRAVGRSFCSFERCHFEDNDIHLQVDNTSRCELRQSQLNSALADGILVHNEAQFLAHNCQILESGWSGLLAVGQSRVLLKDCQLEQHGAHGACLLEEARIESTRSRFAENGQNGLCVDGSGSVVSNQDTFHGNQLCGVDLGDTAQAFLQSCEATNNTSHGFQLRGEAQANLVACQARENASSGLAVFGKSCLTSHDLCSESNHLNGTQFADKSLGLLVRATLSGNRSSGLAAFGQSRPIVERSRLMESLGYGLQVSELAQLHLRDCEILENRKGGLLLSGKGNSFVEGSTVAHNQYHGIAVSESAGVTISENILQGNGKDGILLLGRGPCQLVSNQILRNQRHGIFATSGSRPLLEDNQCRDNIGEQLRVETTQARTSDRNSQIGDSEELPPGVTLSIDNSAEIHLPFQPKPIEKTMLLALLRHKRLSEAALGKAAKSRRVGGAMENLIDRMHKAGVSMIRHEGDGPEGNVYALKLDVTRTRQDKTTKAEHQGREIC